MLVLWEPVFEAALFVLHLAVRGPYQGDAFRWFPERPGGYFLWLLTEVAWWWIAIVLLATAGSFLVRSRAWVTLRDAMAPRSTPAALQSTRREAVRRRSM